MPEYHGYQDGQRWTIRWVFGGQYPAASMVANSKKDVSHRLSSFFRLGFQGQKTR
ncbi:hypothetical protein BGZ61DRAFT_437869 [Ilyonectria robusta]|uniref:uncharacterized protein n=1 Tax=Ilyonectria robusta TaxID=1079257 RepID=UPI001E8DDDDC|nr:uncharacterized protein BGZ61DRAFT_437869 [Ilyonectria robusta]KAH8737216.1 hypothetical protein BGZ61DRAFT_437869 [Ilyonectria robusta]